MGVEAFVSILILFGLFLRKTNFLKHQALSGSSFLLTLRELQIPRFLVKFSKADLGLYCAEASLNSGSVKVSVDRITI